MPKKKRRNQAKASQGSAAAQPRKSAAVPNHVQNTSNGTPGTSQQTSQTQQPASGVSVGQGGDGRGGAAAAETTSTENGPRGPTSNGSGGSATSPPASNAGGKEAAQEVSPSNTATGAADSNKGASVGQQPVQQQGGQHGQIHAPPSLNPHGHAASAGGTVSNGGEIVPMSGQVALAGIAQPPPASQAQLSAHELREVRAFVEEALALDAEDRLRALHQSHHAHMHSHHHHHHHHHHHTHTSGSDTDSFATGDEEDFLENSTDDSMLDDGLYTSSGSASDSSTEEDSNDHGHRRGRGGRGIHGSGSPRGGGRRGHGDLDLPDDLPELLEEVLDEHTHVQSHIAAAAADAHNAAHGVYGKGPAPATALISAGAAAGPVGQNGVAPAAAGVVAVAGGSTGAGTPQAPGQSPAVAGRGTRLADAPPPPPPPPSTDVAASSRRADASVSLLTERLSQLMRDNKALRSDVTALSSSNHALAYERAQQQKQLVDAIASAQNFRSLARTTQAEYETQLRAWSECADRAEKTHQEAIRALMEVQKGIGSSGRNGKASVDELTRENRLLHEKTGIEEESHAVREQLSAATLRHTQLRYQLLEHKMYQQQRQSAAENAKNRHYQEQIETLTKTEAELRSQLALYAEKFEQFQETLTKSNDVFSTFKQEMERMSDTIKKNEKENETLRRKRDQTDVALIDLAEERNRYKKQVEVVRQQKNTLEDLCRVLQTERKDWRAQQKKDKQGGGASAAAPASAPAPGTTPAHGDGQPPASRTAPLQTQPTGAPPSATVVPAPKQTNLAPKTGQLVHPTPAPVRQQVGAPKHAPRTALKQPARQVAPKPSQAKSQNNTTLA